MFFANIQEHLALLLSIKYTHTKSETYNYSTEPRPCHNFVFMLEGECLIETTSKTHHIKPGDILFIPKGTTYISHWVTSPNAIFHSLHFSFQPKNDPLFNKNIPIQILPNDNFDKLYDLLKNIESCQFSKSVDSFNALSSFYGLCGQLLSSVTLLPSKQINKNIIPAIQYLECHYESKISIEQLASLCFISPSRFYFLFKQQTGVSPIVYKNQLIIQHVAQELLYNPEDTITNIAKKYGFSSLIYFERLFKKIVGKSPSQYRNENALL